MRVKLVYLLIFLLSSVKVYAHYCPVELFDRKILGQAENGYYLVQEFHETGEKRTNPYYLKEKEIAEKKRNSASPCLTPNFMTIEGEYLRFRKNGQKFLSGKYNEGHRIGVWKGWAEDGTQYYEVKYTDNSLIGDATYTYLLIKEKSEGKQSYEVGVDMEFYHINNVGTWKYYKDDQLVAEVNYDNQGISIDWQQWCQGKLILKGKRIGQDPYYKAERTFFISENEIKAMGCSVSNF